MVSIKFNLYLCAILILIKILLYDFDHPVCGRTKIPLDITYGHNTTTICIVQDVHNFYFLILLFSSVIQVERDNIKLSTILYNMHDRLTFS